MSIVDITLLLQNVNPGHGSLYCHHDCYVPKISTGYEYPVWITYYGYKVSIVDITLLLQNVNPGDGKLALLTQLLGTKNNLMTKSKKIQNKNLLQCKVLKYRVI